MNKNAIIIGVLLLGGYFWYKNRSVISTEEPQEEGGMPSGGGGMSSTPLAGGGTAYKTEGSTVIVVPTTSTTSTTPTTSPITTTAVRNTDAINSVLTQPTKTLSPTVANESLLAPTTTKCGARCQAEKDALAAATTTKTLSTTAIKESTLRYLGFVNGKVNGGEFFYGLKLR